MTHAEAVALVKGKRNKRERKVANNTTARIESDGSVVFRYHSTDIVTIYPDNTAKLRTGGWYTMTTQQRISEYSPVRVHGTFSTIRRDAGEWHVRPKHGEWTWNVPFTEGMVVDQYQFI